MEPFIGQIIRFAGTFPPVGWAFCDGSLLSISSNEALFSLIGTLYGGDGRTTFALPDLRGRIPIHAGTGPGLSPKTLGSNGGTETNSLSVNNLPSHAHGINPPAKEEGNYNTPEGNFMAGDGTNSYGTTTDSQLSPGSTNNTGSSSPVNNMQPYLAVNYIIALVGVYPSRS